MKQTFAVCCVLLMLAAAGDPLIGTAAPEWNNQRWLNSPPLQLSGLKGKAVFIRFFTDSSCPYCRASAPFLNRLYSRYQKHGLVVIGMYTPKPVPRETTLDAVRGLVKDYGFQFPVTLDNDWATLKKYWLDRAPDADFTSVSFLIDPKGVIRYVHPGGAYSATDIAEIEKRIQESLARFDYRRGAAFAILFGTSTLVRANAAPALPISGQGIRVH